MKKLLDVRLGLVLRHALSLFLALFIMSPVLLSKMGHEAVLGVGECTEGAAFFVFGFYGIAFSKNSEVGRLFTPLLCTAVAHLLLIIGAAAILTPLMEPVKHLDEAAGFLGLAMFFIALTEWSKVIYPGEFEKADADEKAQREAGMFQKQT